MGVLLVESVESVKISMSSEAPLIGMEEIRQRPKPSRVLYFAGILDHQQRLLKIQRALEVRFPDKVEILPSIISLDFPAPRIMKIAKDLQRQLGADEKLEILCHSLGTVEVVRIIMQIAKNNPDFLTKHATQLYLTLISPAGLFPNFLGFPEFLTRAIINSLLQDRQLLPNILRAFSSDYNGDIKPSIANFKEDVWTIGQLMTGLVFRQLKHIEKLGVDIRFVHLGIDPIVNESDIMRFYGNKTWQELLEKGKVISIEGWGHATHTLLPEELISRLYR